MRRKFYKISAIILIIIFLVALFLYRQTPALNPVSQLPVLAEVPVTDLPLPAYGQSALGAIGYGVLAENGNQKPVPIASITKVVTALAVLQQKPLELNQQGPTITLGKEDVAIFNDYYSRGGSVIKIADGTKISEYQALQAMLLPSANNIADSLVRWAFGSQARYLVYANNMLSELSLKDLHVADASGFSPKSVGSAHDLVLLGEIALSNPVLAQIVNQKQAIIPEAGAALNTNILLGKNGIIGIKTGNTDEAGGCYLFAAKQTIEGQSIILIGAILGASNPKNAVSDSSSVIAAAAQNFKKTVVVRTGQEIGYYKAPWGDNSPIVASQDLSVFSWRNTDVSLKSNFASINTPAQKNKEAGSVSVTANGKTYEVKGVLKQSISGPPWHWRLFRL